MKIHIGLSALTVLICSASAHSGQPEDFCTNLKHGVTFEVIDLGNLSSHNHPIVNDINNRGTTIGMIYAAVGSSRTFAHNDAYGIVDLNVAPDPTSVNVTSINDYGSIIGVKSLPGEMPRAFLLQKGSVTQLGVLPNGDNSSWPTKINSEGLIVGISWKGVHPSNAVYWNSNGVAIPLGLPIDSRPADVNDSGSIVGRIEQQAFHWKNGQVTILPPLEQGSPSQAFRINNLGRIIGISKRSYFYRTLYWTLENGSYIPHEVRVPLEFQNLSGFSIDLNNRDYILGKVGNQHYVYHIGTRMFLKLTLPAQLGYTDLTVKAINDKCEIVADVRRNLEPLGIKLRAH